MSARPPQRPGGAQAPGGHRNRRLFVWGICALIAGILALLLACLAVLVPLTAHMLVFAGPSSQADAMVGLFFTGALILGLIGIVLIPVGIVCLVRSRVTPA